MLQLRQIPKCPPTFDSDPVLNDGQMVKAGEQRRDEDCAYDPQTYEVPIVPPHRNHRDRPDRSCGKTHPGGIPGVLKFRLIMFAMNAPTIRKTTSQGREQSSPYGRHSGVSGLGPGLL